MKSLLCIAGLAALCTATPAPLPQPTGPITDPWGDLMTILGFYQNQDCATEPPYWYLTTRLPSFNAAMEQSGGCQAVNQAFGEVTAMRLERKERNCRVTVYTSTDCSPASEAAVTVPEGGCVPAEPGKTWKSFAIRGCLD
ncbi:hypothetical protein QBC40DRAFT_347377 [Triangularia verruculosa]|uniref:Uncharacterized protein n=1 Tax=Triangularia verruculosa TaxID=2587418 RepID=A0AAN6XJU9_9PEZI|nr:hypothetical protein QBC40DRAFT_347377 [Triangularia verruculosa]